LSLYSNPRKTGIKAVKIGDDDAVLAAMVSNGNQEIFLGTRKGMAVRFEETQLRPMGRFVGGVRGIRLREGDEVIGLGILRPDSSILTVCEHGYGKRTNASEYRRTNRGGLGVINIKTSDRNGDVIGCLEVFDSDEVILISKKGLTIRSKMAEMRLISRATQGVRLINLAKGDLLISVARVEEEEPSDSGDLADDAPEGIADASDDASGDEKR
jgi:DNA gyrase subunit A